VRTRVRTQVLGDICALGSVKAMGECSTLAERLEQRERELALLLRLDRIRDQTLDVGRFVGQSVNALIEAVDTHLCVLGLVRAESSPSIVPAVVYDRLGALSGLGSEPIQDALERALSSSAVTRLDPGEEFLSHRLDHLLVAPLIVGEERLGAIVLARGEQPFSPFDLDLVRAAISQIDSAVLHMRTFQRAEERARQLEAIYRVDRIRDEADGARGILPAVVDLAVEVLDADIGLIVLVDDDSGERQVRAVADLHGAFGRLDRNEVRSVLDWAASLTGIEVLERDPVLSLHGLGHLIGAPLIVAGEPLGCLILARRHPNFDRADRDLLAAISSQTDSAIVHARAERRLRQRNKELETLYRVDRIRDQGYGFGEMLSAVLGELCTVIEAEMGFIMLFDYEGQELELRASTADDILAYAGHHHLIDSAAREALRAGALYVAQDLSEWLHSIMCVPLVLRERIIGVFGAVNRLGRERFTVEDRRLLLAITSQVDTAIFESLDKQRIQETFRRYVGPRVMERMLTMPERDYLKGERAHLTVVFTDMRGFTSMGERVPVDVLVEMLNMHLGAMTEIVLGHEGTLDKFVADQVVAIFGAPLYMGDHAVRAVQAAVEMQAVQQGQIRWWAERGYSLPPIGIGVNTGEMVVGNIGCEQQMDYTVIGGQVNLASRLCDVAAGNQILVSEATFDLVAEHVRASKLRRYDLPGIQEPVQVYEIVGLK
jgi:adenylate cyclase